MLFATERFAGLPGSPAVPSKPTHHCRRRRARYRARRRRSSTGTRSSTGRSIVACGASRTWLLIPGLAGRRADPEHRRLRRRGRGAHRRRASWDRRLRPRRPFRLAAVRLHLSRQPIQAGAGPIDRDRIELRLPRGGCRRTSTYPGRGRGARRDGRTGDPHAATWPPPFGASAVASCPTLPSIGNAGSFFKNPVVTRRSCPEAAPFGGKYPAALPSYPRGHRPRSPQAAGGLADRGACGWRGHRDGDAGVSSTACACPGQPWAERSGAQILALARRIIASVGGALRHSRSSPSRASSARHDQPAFFLPASYQAPVFGMLTQGSAAAAPPPFCSSSIEMLSGERTNAMRPSRGGRLIVTPCPSAGTRHRCRPPRRRGGRTRGRCRILQGPS